MNTAEALRTARDRAIEDGPIGLRDVLEAAGLDVLQLAEVANEYAATLAPLLRIHPDHLSAAFMVGFHVAWSVALEDVTE